MSPEPSLAAEGLHFSVSLHPADLSCPHGHFLHEALTTPLPASWLLRPPSLGFPPKPWSLLSLRFGPEVCVGVGVEITRRGLYTCSASSTLGGDVDIDMLSTLSPHPLGDGSRTGCQLPTEVVCQLFSAFCFSEIFPSSPAPIS